MASEPTHAKPLIAALENEPDDWTRSRIAEKLGNLRDPRAVDGLIAALQADPHQFLFTPQRAAEALGKIGDPGAIEPLLHSLQNGDKGTREQSGRALAAGLHPRRGRGQQARERFRKCLEELGGIEQLEHAKQEDPDWEVCEAAKLALQEIDNWGMDPDLRRRLGI